MKNVAFHNLGCKVNSYELDGIQQDFQRAGYKIVDFAQKSDIYIINTCSVTNIADRKSRQMIHKARKENPDSVIVALGCYVQGADSTDEDIDIIIGNNLKSQTLSIVEDYLANRPANREHGKVETYTTDLTLDNEYENITVTDSNEHTRAFIKIQDGCDQYCSYCIIPYVRGHIRSRNIPDIVEEITGLAAKGYREFVLTGIHLSSYGLDEDGVTYNEFANKGRTNTRLLDVINAVSAIEGVKRIRLGSLEPRLMTDDFLKGIGTVQKLCPHFHLSLQSGCDEVLRRMNRHYSTEEFEAVVNRIRETFDHPAITTDVIVGFPGESDEEFEITREYLGRIKLYEVHLFKYSRRRGTVADRMPGQLTDKEKSRRSNILQAECDMRKAEYAKYYVGRDMEILLEDMETIDECSYMVGYSREYVKCAVEPRPGETAENMEGKIVQVRGRRAIGTGALACDFL